MVARAGTSHRAAHQVGLAPVGAAATTTQIVFVLFLLNIWPKYALFLGFLGYVVFCPAIAHFDAMRLRRQEQLKDRGAEA